MIVFTGMHGDELGSFRICNLSIRHSGMLTDVFITDRIVSAQTRLIYTLEHFSHMSEISFGAINPGLPPEIITAGLCA